MAGIVIGNSLLFNVAWLMCVTLSASSVAITLAVCLACHYYFLHKKSLLNETKVDWQAETWWLVLTALIGIMIETLAFSVGVLNYSGTSAQGLVLPPFWLIALWLIFGGFMRVSLGFIFKRWWMPGLLGFLFAPLSYWTGAKLNLEVELADYLLYSLVSIGVLWLITMSIFHLFHRFIFLPEVSESRQ